MKLTEMRTQLDHMLGCESASMTTQERRLALEGLGFDVKNCYQELEMSSQYVDTHEDVSESEDWVSLHSHTFYELLYISQGRLQYLIGTDRYHVQRGDILMIPPGMSHRPLMTDNLAEPYKRCVLWMSSGYMASLQKDFPEFKQLDACRLLRTAGTRWEFLGDLFRSGIREARSGTLLWQAAAAANTSLLLVHLTRAFTDKGNTSPIIEQRELIDDIMLYLENHLSDKITLENTARRFLVSESTISQVFRSRMNVSFYRYVIQRRLIASKDRIIQGETMEQVAEHVGFSDYSAFYRAFRQEYGISPARFRTMMLHGPM